MARNGTLEFTFIEDISRAYFLGGLVGVLLGQEKGGRNKAYAYNVGKSCCSYWSLTAVWNADLTS